MTAVRLTLPWSVLVSVNDRTAPVGRVQRLTHRYRAALNAASALVATQHRGPALSGPVEVVLHFYEPDRRRRDPANFLKLAEDALVGSVLGDDSQIDAEAWRRAGIDRENPRCEITITPLRAA